MNRITLVEPKDGFKLDAEFYKELAKKINKDDSIEQIIAVAIAYFIEKHKSKLI